MRSGALHTQEKNRRGSSEQSQEFPFHDFPSLKFPTFEAIPNFLG